MRICIALCFIKKHIYQFILFWMLISINAYAGTLRPVGTLSQPLSAYGQTGVATWVLPATDIIEIGESYPVTGIEVDSIIRSGYMPPGVTYIISCNVSFSLDDGSDKAFSFIINNGNAGQHYYFPNVINVTKFLGGTCSGQFTNTNGYDVTFIGGNPSLGNVMRMIILGPKTTQLFANLQLDGTLSTTPGCTIELDNPSISVSGTQHDYKQGISVEKILSVECVKDAPQPNIALTSSGAVVSNCILMSDSRGFSFSGPQVCVYEGEKLLPLDFAKKHNITVDQDSGLSQLKLIFKIFTPEDNELSPGNYNAVVYVVISPI